MKKYRAALCLMSLPTSCDATGFQTARKLIETTAIVAGTVISTSFSGCAVAAGGDPVQALKFQKNMAHGYLQAAKNTGKSILTKMKPNSDQE